MIKKRPSLRGYTYNEIESLVLKWNEKKYRTKQLFDFIFNTKITSYKMFSSLPKSLLQNIQKEFLFVSLTKENKYISKNKKTIKYVLLTQDSHKIETVLIKSFNRNTICLSTQIGCRFGCAFCMSGRKGFVRNLDASEIVDQLYVIENDIGERITNVVVMGMGEPFDNYDEVVRAVRICNDKRGFNIGARHITVSTVGIPEGIERFAEEDLNQVKLAISLHAPTEILRSRLMPINAKYSLETLIACIIRKRDAFKRRITLEYLLLDSVNDGIKEAEELAVIAHKIKAKINLIPYNAIDNDSGEGMTLGSSQQENIQLFERVLKKNKVIYTVRKSGGSDISAACGQLSC
ncbi:23S rRNA (adenine(2503)-C(2))-methyltransferase RlmN [Candidatus Omnitrophota bacterium]